MATQISRDLAERLADSDRIQALEATALWQSPPEESFDRLTRVASRVLDVPVSLVTLVSADAQFTKSGCGLPDGAPRELPLSHSFCKHIVGDGKPLVIEDARTHPVVAGSPAVEEFGVIAYLGIPLRTPEGHVLGSFCVIDHEPHAWSEEDIDSVAALAESAMTEIALRLQVQAYSEKEDQLEKRERELQDSEERYRHLFERSPEPIVIHRGEEILTANPAAAELAGVRSAEMLTGQSLCLFVVPAQRATVRERLAMLSRGEDVPPLELTIQPKGGDRRIAESISSLTVWNGELLTQTVLRDVTVRRQAKEQLRQQKEVFEKIFDHLPVMVSFFDEEGNFMLVNRAWEETTGYTLEETAAHPDILEAFYPDPALRQEVLTYMQQGTTDWRAFPMQNRDGETVLAAWANVQLSDGSSIGIGKDITERHQAQLARREHAERLTLALQAARMGTWDYNMDTGYVTWSTEAEALFGLDPGTFANDKNAFYDLLHPEDRQMARHAIEQITRQEDPDPLDISYRVRSEEGTRWLRSVGRVLRGETDGHSRMIGVVMDVTQQRRFEEGLLEAREEAERARREAEEMARLKDSFLSNMSHEIRTPLASIIGFADILDEELSDGANEMVSIIRSSAHRLQETLNSVLSLAQLESGTNSLSPEHFSLVEEVREVARILSPQADLSGLELHVQLPPRDLRAHVDRRALHRILMNLVSNAIKFTDEGHVRLGLRDVGTEIELVIEDTGIGMDPEMLPELFEAFRQGSEGLSRQYEGAGLGLAITSRLVKLLDGSIDVDTELGGGSTFRVRLPKQADPSATQELAMHLHTSPTGDSLPAEPVDLTNHPEATGSPIRALFVDDSPEMQALVPRFLRSSCDVTLVATAREALTVAEEETFELLLLDISLSGPMSGEELLSELRKRPAYADAPAVALTAHALPGAKERFLAAGFDAYLAKPFTGTRLREEIDELIGERSA